MSITHSGNQASPNGANNAATAPAGITTAPITGTVSKFATNPYPVSRLKCAAAKGAVDSFTVGLAKEVADEGILVNAVRPGLVDTDIHASGGQPDRAERLRPLIPVQRVGTAPEIASVIAFLCSDAASYLCGAIIDVSGGR